MEDYKHNFLQFALDTGVLRFGEFRLKSGRVSPYFFNTGLFNTGASLAKLGRYYAQAAVHSDIEFDLVFGPSYKGIPLVSALASSLFDEHDLDIPYAFDRKEVKDHGEGGIIVGHPLEGKKVLIVDDVISSGVSVRDSVDIIEKHGAKATGVLIALDRHERGEGAKSTIREIEEDMGIKVANIVSINNLIEYLEKSDNKDALARIKAYNQEYGAE